MLAGAGFDEPEKLIGNFLLKENDQGFVDVTTYASEAELVADYNTLEEYYSLWDAEGDDGSV